MISKQIHQFPKNSWCIRRLFWMPAELVLHPPPANPCEQSCHKSFWKLSPLFPSAAPPKEGNKSYYSSSFLHEQDFFQSNSVGNSTAVTAADRNTITQMDQNPKGPKTSTRKLCKWTPTQIIPKKLLHPESIASFTHSNSKIAGQRKPFFMHPELPVFTYSNSKIAEQNKVIFLQLLWFWFIPVIFGSCWRGKAFALDPT